jgi:predicted metal-dependent hydrolase
MSAPPSVSTAHIQAFAESKLRWIRDKRAAIISRGRESTGHFLWGQPYQLRIEERDAKPHIRHDDTGITLVARPGSDGQKRADIVREWHKTLLHAAIPPLLEKWQTIFGVTVNGYYLQRMKTRWGTCNICTGRIRLNTELVNQPKNLLEYVIAHETAHLVEPSHNARFKILLDKHYPAWRKARAQLTRYTLGRTRQCYK